MRSRRIIGDSLVVLTAAFTVYLSVIMTRRINSVVLKSDYREIFMYELAVCAFFMLFALDIRFGLFTRFRSRAAKRVGWAVRAVVCCLAAALLFLFGRIYLGGVIRTAEPARHVIVLGMALEIGRAHV